MQYQRRGVRMCISRIVLCRIRPLADNNIQIRIVLVETKRKRQTLNRIRNRDKTNCSKPNDFAYYYYYSYTNIYIIFRGADQDRALRELVSHMHVDSHRWARWAQRLNHRNESLHPWFQPNSPDEIHVATAVRVVLRQGFGDTRATVRTRVISRTCFEQHSPLLLFRLMGFQVAHQPSAARALRRRNTHSRMSPGT